MASTERLVRLASEEPAREVSLAQAGDTDLGPLQQLPGKWVGEGTGWNMIALPFATAGPPFRLLLNQYDETLNFTLVDKAVPNRGIGGPPVAQTDQFVVTLDYEQVIRQVAATDQPPSPFAGGPNLAIHHEPGLFLNMLNEIPDGFDIARLATIPHGDAVLALGTSSTVTGTPVIPAVNGLPIGVSQDLEGRYLAPYKFFHDTPFVGTVTFPGFPGFDPVNPHLLLELANQGQTFVSTTKLELSTTNGTAGIHNIPFVVKQANAASMNSTFWIQELQDPANPGRTTLRMQYLQTVMLDFFPRTDGLPGLIGWPHVSINTLTKVSDTPDGY